MESSKNSKKLNKLRKDLNDKLLSLSDNDKNENSIENTSTLKLEDAKIDTHVFIPSLNQYGKIISNPSSDSKVMVLVGNIKMSFDISKLTLSDKKEDKKIISNDYNSKSTFTPKDIKTEINVIGYNIEEATYVIDKFLDNAALSKLEQVRIVHGKGTGILGKGIQKYLKTHPHVDSYRYGTFGEGEMGATIVFLKR